MRVSGKTSRGWLKGVWVLEIADWLWVLAFVNMFPLQQPGVWNVGIAVKSLRR